MKSTQNLFLRLRKIALIKLNKQHITVDNSYMLLYTVYQEEEEPDETDN